MRIDGLSPSGRLEGVVLQPYLLIKNRSLRGDHRLLMLSSFLLVGNIQTTNWNLRNSGR